MSCEVRCGGDPDADCSLGKIEMDMVAHSSLSKAKDAKGWRHRGYSRDIPPEDREVGRSFAASRGAAINRDQPFLVRYADIVFALKTFAAVMLALVIALWLDLPRPYWAMATVYITSQPLAGATSSKAFYRLTGNCARRVSHGGDGAQSRQCPRAALLDHRSLGRALLCIFHCSTRRRAAAC